MRLEYRGWWWISLGATVQEAEEAFQAGIGILVDMLGHGVVHEGVVFVTDHPTGIGDLGDIPGSLASIGSATVPDLIVEQDDAACFPEVGVDVGIPFCTGQVGWARGTEQVRAWNALSGSVLYFSNIRQIIVGGEEKDGEVHVFRGGAFGDDVVRRIILMPGCEPSSWGCLERVVVYDMAGMWNDGFCERHDGFQVEKPQVRRAVFKHPVAEPGVHSIDVETVRVFRKGPIKVFTHLQTPFGRQDILKEEEALFVKGVYPRFDLGFISGTTCKIGVWHRFS